MDLFLLVVGIFRVGALALAYRYLYYPCRYLVPPIGCTAAANMDEVTMSRTQRTAVSVGLAVGLAMASSAQAEEDAGPARRESEQTGIEQLREEMRTLQEIVARQHDEIRRLQARQEAEDLTIPPHLQQAAYRTPRFSNAGGAYVAVQAEGGEAAQTAQSQPQPQRQESAEVPVLPEPAGVLTPPGMLVIEPSVEYQHSDVNRFVAGGVAILDTVLVGVFEATQANRDTVTAALTARTGITNRFEVEAKVPYIYRNDSTTNTVVSSNSSSPVKTSIDGYDIGDVEFAGRYQLNNGTGRWPVFVGNLRVKSTTGQGPFDVERNASGVETELATGSGFWGVEPSLTVIVPSDPVVFFGNLGYLWNVADDVDTTVGTPIPGGTAVRITHVDPGDAIRLSLGMGLALNERTSFSLGYQHDFIWGTETETSSGNRTSESLNVGSLSFGVNYQMTETVALNATLSAGITGDAPDMRFMIRTPISINF